MDQLRRRVSNFDAAWDAMPPAPKRVLVLRCGGLTIKEVGLQLGITPYTVREYSKSVMESMRDATGEADLLALCWLYGYSRALRDIDERLARKQRGT
jgi:DNA-binding CsgD family transcriptional regulator